MISSSPCYRKRWIPALLVLAGLSGLPAFSEDAVKGASDPNSVAAEPAPVTASPKSVEQGSPEMSAGKTEVKTSEEVKATEASPAETQATEVKPPTWHRMQMRLSGSMCYACLKDLEEALKKVQGIDRVKIDKPKPTYYQPLSPDVSSWAEGVVIFDGEKIPLEYVRATIKKNGYHSYRVVDKVLDRDPIEKDLKL